MRHHTRNTISSTAVSISAPAGGVSHATLGATVPVAAVEQVRDLSAHQAGAQHRRPVQRWLQARRAHLGRHRRRQEGQEDASRGEITEPRGDAEQIAQCLPSVTATVFASQNKAVTSGSLRSTYAASPHSTASLRPTASLRSTAGAMFAVIVAGPLFECDTSRCGRHWHTAHRLTATFRARDGFPRVIVPRTRCVTVGM